MLQNGRNNVVVVVVVGEACTVPDSAVEIAVEKAARRRDVGRTRRLVELAERGGSAAKVYSPFQPPRRAEGRQFGGRSGEAGVQNRGA